MISCIRTNSSNKDFQQLVNKLDAELAIRDGDQHSFYDQFNKIVHIKHAIVAYENDIAVGCGAFKEHSADTLELKRMFVLLDYRNKGIASKVLSMLEEWARELKYKKCILETGKNQPEAIALYTKNEYSSIPNFGQYIGIENSVCFEKIL